MARFGSLGTQYFDGSGDPLINGLINFYESGTTTRKAIYADIAQTVQHPNPVPLTAAGRQPDIFFDGTAKAILTTAAGTQIAWADPVGETSTSFGAPWVAGRIYNGNEVVLGSNGKFYKSREAANQNNDPTVSPDQWSLLYSIQWSAAETYAIGANVTDDDGLLYQSLQAGNINNPPSTSPTFWIYVAAAWLPTYTYATGQNAVASDGILYTSLQDDNIGNDPVSEPTFWAGTSAAAAASAAAASDSEVAAIAAQAAAELAETGAQAAETAAASSAAAAATSEANAETAEQSAETIAAAIQDAAGLPSLTGNALKSLTVNSAETGVEWAFSGAISQSSTKTDTATTTSTSFVDTGIEVTITLQDASSSVLLLASVSGSSNQSSGTAFALERSGSLIGIGDAAEDRLRSSFGWPQTPSAVAIQSASGSFVDTPGAVGPHVYKLKWRVGASGTSFLNRTESDSNNAAIPRAISTLSAIEVA